MCHHQTCPKRMGRAPHLNKEREQKVTLEHQERKESTAHAWADHVSFSPHLRFSKLWLTVEATIITHLMWFQMYAEEIF